MHERILGGKLFKLRILFSLWELIRCRITPFLCGYLRLISLYKSFSDTRDAVTQTSLALLVLNIKLTSDVSTVMMLGYFVAPA